LLERFGIQGRELGSSPVTKVAAVMLAAEVL
jgi:hypothetical protein